MAKCPNCGVTVAFHATPSVECHGCGKKLYPRVGQDAAGFRLTTASLRPTSDKPPTQSQNEARSRNWEIRKLRAYFHLCPIRSKRGKQIQALIDKELVRLGAESEIEREKQRYRQMMAEASASEHERRTKG